MKNELAHETPAHMPMRGQLYQDFYGRYLRVEAVIHSEVLDGFFIVRLSIGATEECKDDLWVLGRSEFAALSRDRGLQLVTSGEQTVLDFASAKRRKS